MRSTRACSRSRSATLLGKTPATEVLLRMAGSGLGVNTAGIANAAPAEDMPLEQWQKV